MLTISVAIVSEVSGHDPGDVARVTAALQRQAIRDFHPVWGVEATVDSFPTLEDVPVGYWPILVRNDIDTARGGGHSPRQRRTAVRARADERQLVADGVT